MLITDAHKGRERCTLDSRHHQRGAALHKGPLLKPFPPALSLRLNQPASGSSLGAETFSLLPTGFTGSPTPLPQAPALSEAAMCLGRPPAAELSGCRRALEVGLADGVSNHGSGPSSSHGDGGPALLQLLIFFFKI